MRPTRPRSDRIDAQLGTVRGKPLSPREWEVADALLAGCTSRKHIARRLTVATGTVSHHLWQYAKTGATTLAELVLILVGRLPSANDLTKGKPNENR